MAGSRRCSQWPVLSKRYPSRSSVRACPPRRSSRSNSSQGARRWTAVEIPVSPPPRMTTGIARPGRSAHRRSRRAIPSHAGTARAKRGRPSETLTAHEPRPAPPDQHQHRFRRARARARPRAPQAPARRAVADAVDAVPGQRLRAAAARHRARAGGPDAAPVRGNGGGHVRRTRHRDDHDAGDPHPGRSVPGEQPPRRAPRQGGRDRGRGPRATSISCW